MDVERYWRAALAQNAQEMRPFFRKDAVVRWPNTNEQFMVEEFLRANCEYPGSWDGQIERLEQTGSLLITAVHVYSRDKTVSCHVTSFFKLRRPDRRAGGILGRRRSAAPLAAGNGHRKAHPVKWRNVRKEKAPRYATGELFGREQKSQGSGSMRITTLPACSTSAAVRMAVSS